MAEEPREGELREAPALRADRGGTEGGRPAAAQGARPAKRSPDQPAWNSCFPLTSDMPAEATRSAVEIVNANPWPLR